ncbi:hypothetical protein SKAU_G00189450 [Synaphobranchus kaupii]|uniref:Uncharacterized protein n=1 Tax=Synaphobranchus kaupii TaxID=118154 RepID=A0A9Q1FDE5_SYNKA|nr:hypothetical protein SKAU_G00189450 [Synaphobranchus kaupii]
MRRLSASGPAPRTPRRSVKRTASVVRGGGKREMSRLGRGASRLESAERLGAPPLTDPYCSCSSSQSNCYHRPVMHTIPQGGGEIPSVCSEHTRCKRPKVERRGETAAGRERPDGGYANEPRNDSAGRGSIKNSCLKP